MVPMQLNKHCHSRDLAARIPAIYFALHWPIVALFTRIRNIFCHLTVAPALKYFKYAAKPMAGACMALAICDGSDDDMPALEA